MTKYLRAYLLMGPLALLAQLALAPPAAAETIYALENADGSITLSNVPTTRGYKALLGDDPAPPRAVPPLVRDAPAHRRFDDLIAQTARNYGLDSALLNAVITVESGYDPRAHSRKGASGLMQLMPDTARRYGVADALDPVQNVQGGARYLRDLLKQFDRDLNLVLAAYNAGEKAVARYGNSIPPYPETTAYVPRVLAYYRKYQAGAQDTD